MTRFIIWFLTATALVTIAGSTTVQAQRESMTDDEYIFDALVRGTALQEISDLAGRNGGTAVQKLSGKVVARLKDTNAELLRIATGNKLGVDDALKKGRAYVADSGLAKPKGAAFDEAYLKIMSKNLDSVAKLARTRGPGSGEEVRGVAKRIQTDADSLLSEVRKLTAKSE
jgi:predicted outer membrane protein